MSNESARPLTPDDLPNWQNVIGAIQASGMSQTEIGTKIGVTQGTISNLATGRTKTVEYSMGVALLALLDEVGSTPKPSEAAA